MERPSYDGQRSEYEQQRSDYDQSRQDYDQRDARRELPEQATGSGHVHRGGPVGPNLPASGAPARWPHSPRRHPAPVNPPRA